MPGEDEKDTVEAGDMTEDSDVDMLWSKWLQMLTFFTRVVLKKIFIKKE